VLVISAEYLSKHLSRNISRNISAEYLSTHLSRNINSNISAVYLSRISHLAALIGMPAVNQGVGGVGQEHATKEEEAGGNASQGERQAPTPFSDEGCPVVDALRG
jgi:hypothetical protein